MRGEGGGAEPLPRSRGRVLAHQSHGPAGQNLHPLHLLHPLYPWSLLRVSHRWKTLPSLLQVFMLDTQCSPKTPSSKDGFEHAQSCLLIIEVPCSQAANGHPQKR